MKNKKGFTLTELLVVIVIILALTTTTLLSMDQVQKNAAKKRLKELTKEIEVASDVYLNTHPEITTNILNGSVTSECVRIYTLQSVGLLGNNLKNPVDNSSIPANLCVNASLEDGVVVSHFELN